MKIDFQFPKRQINAWNPTWCVDGRYDDQVSPGPKLLGGSIHLVVLWALFHKKKIDQETISQIFARLKKAGYGVGVHRGHHHLSEPQLSDCGFADNLPMILEITCSYQQEIRLLVRQIYETYQQEFLPLKASFNEEMNTVVDIISSYERGMVQLVGEELVNAAITAGAINLEVMGEHEEEVAFINTEVGTTLDNKIQRAMGKQAFNLDIWMAMLQSKVLGLPYDFSLLASLLLYAATEIVLVERKGKPALSLVTHTAI